MARGSGFFNTINNINGTITVAAFIVGLGITWGTLISKTSSLEDDFLEYKTATKERIIMLERQVYQLELNRASSDVILKNIDSNVTELKEEVKKINKGN